MSEDSVDFELVYQDAGMGGTNIAEVGKAARYLRLVFTGTLDLHVFSLQEVQVMAKGTPSLPVACSAAAPVLGRPVITVTGSSLMLTGFSDADTRAKLFTVAGRVVAEYDLPKGRPHVTGHLSAGTYVVQLAARGLREARKVIVSR